WCREGDRGGEQAQEHETNSRAIPPTRRSSVLPGRHPTSLHTVKDATLSLTHSGQSLPTLTLASLLSCAGMRQRIASARRFPPLTEIRVEVGRCADGMQQHRVVDIAAADRSPPGSAVIGGEAVPDLFEPQDREAGILG